VDSCSYDTLYHSRRNDRDREDEYDRGIRRVNAERSRVEERH